MNETIWCIAHACAISPEGCVTRQKNAVNGRPGVAAMRHPGALDYACKNCEQGRLVAAAMREEKKMGKDSGNAGAKKAPAKTRVCSDPRCEHLGRAQPIENFARSKQASDGIMKVCRSCWARRIAEGRERKNRGEAVDAPAAEARATGGSPVQVDATMEGAAVDKFEGRRIPEAAARPRYDRHPSLLIDFTGYEDLLEKIRGVAADEMRSPEMQVLYWIRQHNLAV